MRSGEQDDTAAPSNISPAYSMEPQLAVCSIVRNSAEKRVDSVPLDTRAYPRFFCIHLANDEMRRIATLQSST